jgi:energy-coupling factor transporter ATP-binding protein EcfA2
MNPVKEKVKDIVDVRNYTNIRDFSASPKDTLASYHFTDITSEMMGKWLDRISVVQARGGAAYALAGYRGVGKSHFLAVLGAIVSHTELRSTVNDTHIAAGAQRLLRRHYPVVHVRRGTQPTLIAELEEALATAFPERSFDFDGTIGTILQLISESTGELPTVLLIDTAFERGMRVARDDGPVLGELGQLVSNLNIFVGVALDDDIAGADGVNADIARTFSIDYLDQEHLYTVVNRHVFPKFPAKQAVLQEVYQFFRSVLPNFRWSEQKFTALYPLHPAILDVAPFIRLHVYDFALLGFASEAGERILGRPAMSLIALDEVFDRVEQNLRNIQDLTEAFAAYDRLNTDVVTKIPVMQRLQAKLILKALMLLSLDGQGASAAEIAQSMLIFDESDPAKAIRTVDELIAKFTEALPEDIQITSLEGRETKYGFRMSSKGRLNDALDKAADECTNEQVTDVLIRLFKERFPEAAQGADQPDARRDTFDCGITWRGSIRKGRITFGSGDSDSQDGRSLDWEVRLDLFQEESGADAAGPEAETIIWRPAKLTLSELDTLKRYHALVANAAIRTEFADQIQAPIHSHAVASTRILMRSFFEDGILVVDGFDYNFTEEARDAPTLGGVFTVMLESMFETRFPEHPFFGATLSGPEASALIAGLYGSGSSDGSANALRDFAEPLGLGRFADDRFDRFSAEQLVERPYFAKVVELVEGAKDPVLLDTVANALNTFPYGLVRESQRLVMTALVAERKLEFITSKGDRITHRSLDLKLIWDDIVGIAPATEASLSNDRLLSWANLLSGGKPFKSFSDASDRKELLAGLSEQLHGWEQANLLDRFDKIPDDLYNTRIWRTSSAVGKSFSVFADAVSTASDNGPSLIDAVTRIATSFSDSEDEYLRKRGELTRLEDFIRAVELYENIRRFIAEASFTGVESIEVQRINLNDVADLCILDPSDARNREAGYLFDKFRKDFAKHFVAEHEKTMRSHNIQEACDAIRSGASWSEFSALANSGLLSGNDLNTVSHLASMQRELDCKACTQELIYRNGSCLCSFDLDSSDEWEAIADDMVTALTRCQAAFREWLMNDTSETIEELKAYAENAPKDRALVASRLIQGMKSGSIPPLGHVESDVLAAAKRTIRYVGHDGQSMVAAADILTGSPVTEDEVIFMEA